MPRSDREQLTTLIAWGWEYERAGIASGQEGAFYGDGSILKLGYGAGCTSL